MYMYNGSRQLRLRGQWENSINHPIEGFRCYEAFAVLQFCKATRFGSFMHYRLYGVIIITDSVH